MPKSQTRQRTISYFRAAWKHPPGISLEEALRSCLQNCQNATDTQLPLRNMRAEVRHRRLAHQKVCLHIAAWTEKESASTVPHQVGVPEADLDESVPDATWDYLDGDGMVLISGDHCLLMPSGLHLKSMELYLRLLLENARDKYHVAIPEHMERFELIPVADETVVKKIRQEGVKKIHLNVEQYLETARDSGSEPLKIMRRLGRAILEYLVENEKDRRQIEEAANVRAQLIISLDGRKPGLSPDDLTPVAKNLADEDENNVEIETSRGYRIRHGKIALKKSVDVTIFAKTVHHGDAWEQIIRYLGELDDGGMLEQ